MKKTVGKKLVLSKETLRVIEPNSLDKVEGGLGPTIVVTVILITMLAGDTPR